LFNSLIFSTICRFHDNFCSMLLPNGNENILRTKCSLTHYSWQSKYPLSVAAT
jgi:hypothetical protein